MKRYVVIVAGGKGTRMGADVFHTITTFIRVTLNPGLVSNVLYIHYTMRKK